MSENITVINAENMILGRLATQIADYLLTHEDEEVYVVNAKKAVISGDKTTVVKRYKAKRAQGSKEWGPYFPKQSDRILKRTVRGMLPYKKPRGRSALKRLKVFKNVPEDVDLGQAKSFADAAADNLKMKNYTALTAVSQGIGGE